MEKEKLTDVPLHQIQIKDAFWDKYIRLVKDVILPYQWNTLNDNVKDAAPSHCIKNFKIAAGVVCFKRLIHHDMSKSLKTYKATKQKGDPHEQTENNRPV